MSDTENTIRAIFKKYTMPEAGDPDLTMFDTDAIIKELEHKLAQEVNKARLETAEQLRDKIYGFLHVLPLTMNDKEAILNIDYEFEEYIVQLTADKAQS